MAITDYLSGINRATTGEKTDVSNATKDLATLQAGSGSLVSKLKEALNTKLNNNKDIIDQQSETMGNYFNSGPAARVKYQDVFDPFKKAELVQQDRTMALRPYDTLSGVLKERMGSVADVVDAGVSGWKGLVDAATTKAQLAKDNLSTALQSYFKAADQQSAADDMAFKKAQAEEASRQFQLNYGLDVTKVNNQASQFAQDLAARLRIASMSGGSGGTAADKSAKLTADLVNGLVEKTGGDPSKIWNEIHLHEGAWSKQGADMNTIWGLYKAAGGGQPAPAPQPSQISKLFNIVGGSNPYGSGNLMTAPYTTKL